MTVIPSSPYSSVLSFQSCWALWWTFTLSRYVLSSKGMASQMILIKWPQFNDYRIPGNCEPSLRSNSWRYLSWTLGQHKLHGLLSWFQPTPMAAAETVSPQIVATIEAVSPQILDTSSLRALSSHKRLPRMLFIPGLLSFIPSLSPGWLQHVGLESSVSMMIQICFLLGSWAKKWVRLLIQQDEMTNWYYQCLFWCFLFWLCWSPASPFWKYWNLSRYPDQAHMDLCH